MMLQSPTIPIATTMASTIESALPRKRKAESHDEHDRERLSKRFGLLDLERHWPDCYTCPDVSLHVSAKDESGIHDGSSSPMRLDDTKHKVYIYNIDDELNSASEDDSRNDSDSEDGHNQKLIFLPEIEEHLRKNRIPPHILANADGELAGMQLVLYSDPKSLSVPEEHDGVRRAIIEARQRLREKQGSASSTTSRPDDSKSPVHLAENPVDAAFQGTYTGSDGGGSSDPWSGFSTNNNCPDSPDPMDMD